MNNLNFKELEEINGGGRTWDNISTAAGVGYRYIKNTLGRPTPFPFFIPTWNAGSYLGGRPTSA